MTRVIRSTDWEGALILIMVWVHKDFRPQQNSISAQVRFVTLVRTENCSAETVWET